MLTSTGRFATEHGVKYVAQLCKHFAHKVEASFDDTEGRAALPPGPAVLRAEPGALVVEVTAADADGLTRAKGIIDSHLERFAFREGFTQMTWEDA